MDGAGNEESRTSAETDVIPSPSTQRTYVVRDVDIGHCLSVQVTFTDLGGNEEQRTSAKTAIVPGHGIAYEVDAGAAT